MVVVAAVAVAAPFFITDKNGKPLMSLDGVRAPEVVLPSALNEAVSTLRPAAGEAAGTVQVFKWQDETGVWHFSDTREEGQAVTAVTVNPNANLLHFETPRRLEARAVPPAEEGANAGADGIPLPLSAPVASVPKLIGDAKNIDRLQIERLQRQEKIVQD